MRRRARMIFERFVPSLSPVSCLLSVRAFTPGTCQSRQANSEHLTRRNVPFTDF
jgi:hypothetical protein